jgi:hypothetical protein
LDLGEGEKNFLKLNPWNATLRDESVSKAYLNILGKLRWFFEKSEISLDEYYGVWPISENLTKFWTLFVPNFFSLALVTPCLPVLGMTSWRAGERNAA